MCKIFIVFYINLVDLSHNQDCHLKLATVDCKQTVKREGGAFALTARNKSWFCQQTRRDGFNSHGKTVGGWLYVCMCASVCVCVCLRGRLKTEGTLPPSQVASVCCRQSVSSSIPTPAERPCILHFPLFRLGWLGVTPRDSKAIYSSAPPPLPSPCTHHSSPVLPWDTLRICVDSSRSRYFTDAADVALSRVQRNTPVSHISSWISAQPTRVETQPTSRD